MKNTDREIYHTHDDSIHVTQGGGIGINVAGNVIVKPLRGWHALASIHTGCEFPACDLALPRCKTFRLPNGCSAQSTRMREALEKAAYRLRELGYVDFANDCLAASQSLPAATVTDGSIREAREAKEILAARIPNEPQGARKPSAWRVCWVSFNTSRTELFEDYAKATGKARETGGCVIPLHPERGPNEVS